MSDDLRPPRRMYHRAHSARLAPEILRSEIRTVLDPDENLAKYIFAGLGCPDFPPAQQVFRDRGKNYFVSTVMPGGDDVDAIRRLVAKPTVGAIPAYFMADVIDFILELLIRPRKGPGGQVVVTREPEAGRDVWDVVYISEMIPVKKDQLGKRMCALLSDWDNHRETF